MLSPFEQAISDSFATLADVAGVQITYRRGTNSVTLTAVPGQSKFDLADDMGMVTTLKVQDFLMLDSDLQFNGVDISPASGDRIEVQRADGSQVYQVMGPGGGEPDWRYSDTARSRVRVHTKFLEAIE